MRILLLTHAFNSLTQRLGAALQERGHEISIEFDIADSVAEEAVALFRPDLIVAPYLRRAIPESIWKRHVCLVVHPGIVGDRGPSALDWALQEGTAEWGVTVLQAEAEMDAGLRVFGRSEPEGRRRQGRCRPEPDAARRVAGCAGPAAGLDEAGRPRHRLAAR